MGAGNYGWCVAKTEAVPRDKVEYYLHTSLRVSHFSYLHVQLCAYIMCTGREVQISLLAAHDFSRPSLFQLSPDLNSSIGQQMASHIQLQSPNKTACAVATNENGILICRSVAWQPHCHTPIATPPLPHTPLDFHLALVTNQQMTVVMCVDAVQE